MPVELILFMAFQVIHFKYVPENKIQDILQPG
jgi:hypothetical protein